MGDKNYKFKCFNTVVYAFKDEKGHVFESFYNFPDCMSDPKYEVGQTFFNRNGEKLTVIGKKEIQIPESILNVIGW